MQVNGFLNRVPDDFLSNLEQDILIQGLSDLKNNFYDYLHGGLGACVYFLETESSDFSIKALSFIVDYIEKNAEFDDDGIKWNEDSFLNIPPDGSFNPNKEYNLGLAHGIPSIALLLSSIYKRGINTEKSKSLVQGSVDWLLKQRIELNGEKLFPLFVRKDYQQKTRSQLGWCYGDLGISMALWKISENMDYFFLKEKIIEYMFETLKNVKAELQGRNFDAGLCHGTSSIAHIYNRFYHYSKIEKFKTQSQFWFSQTFEQQKHSDGIARFKTHYSTGDVNCTGLLEGVSGIGLSLIGAISDIEPKWDKCLLLS